MSSAQHRLSYDHLLQILELSRQFAGTADVAKMLDLVVAAATRILEADSGSIWLFDEDREILHMRVPLTARPLEVAADHGLVGACFMGREVINVPDCYADPRFNQAIDRATGYRTRGNLSIPLIGADGHAVGVLQVLNKHRGDFTSGDEVLGLALAAQGAVALERAQTSADREAMQRMNAQMRVASQLQNSTLPATMPVSHGYDFHGGFLPTDDTGGDLFDLVEHGNEIFVLLGDATGHGVGPALSATQLQAMLRVALRVGANLSEAYLHVNNQLVEDLPDDKFLTAFMGLLDPASGVLTYHAPGQGPLLHYHAATGTVTRYPPTSFPMGVMELDDVPPPETVQLAPGDLFAVISDGVYEYHDADKAHFGEARVETLLCEHQDLSMQDLQIRLLKEVEEFAGSAPQLDDMTIVLLKRHPNRVVLQCERSAQTLEEIISATARFFNDHGIDNDIRGIVDLATEELFINMVNYNTQTSATITLTLETLDRGIKVTLQDRDVERFDPTARPPVDVAAPMNEREPGGLGIHLTREMVDSIDYDYRDRISTVSFTKRPGSFNDVPD